MAQHSDDETEETRQTPKALIEGAVDGRVAAYLIVLTGVGVGEMYKLDKDVMIIGREVRAEICIFEESVSRQHAQIRFERDKHRAVLSDLGSRNGTYVNGQAIAEHVLEDGDRIRLGSNTILKYTLQDALDEEFQRKLYDSALRDALTGAFNRRYFIERLEHELRFAQRHAAALAVILFDVDHFKRVNDTRGHVAGDRVLSGIAKRVVETIRVEDVFARHGGEEFAVICRSITPANAALLAERLREAVQREPFDVGEGERIPVTISLGVAGLPDVQPNDGVALLEIADGALYSAKHAGRNRVQVATPTTRTRVPRDTRVTVAAGVVPPQGPRIKDLARTRPPPPGHKGPARSGG